MEKEHQNKSEEKADDLLKTKWIVYEPTWNTLWEFFELKGTWFLLHLGSHHDIGTLSIYLFWNLFYTQLFITLAINDFKLQHGRK